MKEEYDLKRENDRPYDGMGDSAGNRRKSPVAAVWILTLLLVLTGGCEAVSAVTASTRGKSIAAGSDTWGGGLEAKTATADCPVPGFECWFGRRKVWYASVRDRATGTAAAEIVRASNSSLSLAAAADGLTVENRSSRENAD